MPNTNGGFSSRRNEYGYPVLASGDWETTYALSRAQAMLAHRVTGAIMALLFGLGAIGWVWTFVLSR